MKLKSAAAGAAVLLLLAPASALAATEVVTGSVAFDGSTFTLSGFNTSLGTLTGVTLNLAAGGTLDVSILNFTSSADAEVTHAQTTFDPLVAGPDGLSLTTELETEVNNVTLNPTFITTYTSDPLSASASLVVAASGFSAFEGGPVSFHAVFDPSFTSIPFSFEGQQGNSAPEAFGGGGDVTATLGVTYTYAAVPEPTAWALMLVGFGGLGALARHRRAAVA
jgi:hypothetical protein